MQPAVRQVILALGSNLGNRQALLRTAIQHLQGWLVDIVESQVYATAPRYVEEQPEFLNMAIRGGTQLSPTELLSLIQHVELELGRVRMERYGPRHIDIDIIYYAERIVRMPNLTIPHPLRAERQFVLAPVAEIAADFIDPESGETVGAMQRALPASDDDCTPLGTLAAAPYG